MPPQAWNLIVNQEVKKFHINWKEKWEHALFDKLLSIWTIAAIICFFCLEFLKNSVVICRKIEIEKLWKGVTTYLHRIFLKFLCIGNKRMTLSLASPLISNNRILLEHTLRHCVLPIKACVHKETKYWHLLKYGEPFIGK